MSFLFPRFAYGPAVRCAAPTFRHEVAPFFSLFDESMRELNALTQAVRRQPLPFNPRFDVKEDKESYTLEGEVPGFAESDLSIEWNNNTLAIRGRHESTKESGTKPSALLDGQTQTKAVEDAPAAETPSDKVKSHQATVEDEEQPANASAVVAAESAHTEVEKSTTADEAQVAETKQPEAQHWISERTTGEFLRRFSFPTNAVNQDAIKASLESGILKIVVPKLAQQPAKTINIE